jgi:hypothetical protein
MPYYWSTVVMGHTTCLFHVIYIIFNLTQRDTSQEELHNCPRTSRACELRSAHTQHLESNRDYCELVFCSRRIPSPETLFVGRLNRRRCYCTMPLWVVCLLSSDGLKSSDKWMYGWWVTVSPHLISVPLAIPFPDATSSRSISRVNTFLNV